MRIRKKAIQRTLVAIVGVGDCTISEGNKAAGPTCVSLVLRAVNPKYLFTSMKLTSSLSRVRIPLICKPKLVSTRATN